MTAPQHVESGLNATFINELSDISLKLYPNSPDVKSLLCDYSDHVERICSGINLDQCTYFLDLIMILIEGLEQLAYVDRNISSSECAFLQKVPKILSEYQTLPAANQADEHLLELLKDPHWIRPLTTDEENELLISKHTDQSHTQDCGSVEIDDVLSSINADRLLYNTVIGSDKNVLDIVENPQQKIHSEITSTIPDISASQQELIDLIRAELEEIVENRDILDNDLTESDLENRKNILNNMADQAENISNAVSLIGLDGLSQCGKFISKNIHIFSLTAESLSTKQIFMLKQWPIKLSGYLQNINDSNAIAELLTLLTNDAWNEALDGTECTDIKNLLENPVFIEDEQVERQQKATEEDIDLSLPVDVNQELLDGLLQDLPAQTEEFSNAIQNISEGGGLENIDVAQRIAHTLKGAANVVGVNGIANLTHHLEDILQAQAKAKAMPQKPLIEVLVRASDCLESMAESLLCIDTQPEDALDVLQDVLDWANKLDVAAVSQIDIRNDEPDPGESDRVQVDISDNIVEKPDTKIEKIRDQKNMAAENILRIPVSLADEMLRVAGENLIYTSQIQEHINVISKKQDAIGLHNQSLLQLSYDLEHLIDIQGFLPGSDTSSIDDVFDSLELDEYHEVHTISRRLVEIAADSVEIYRELDKDLLGLKELMVNQNQLHKEGEELVLRTRMVSIKTIIPRLKRGVRQASRLTGKKVELIVSDNNAYMDSEVLSNLIEPLMHILRNSIDHGIEFEKDRLANGKMPGGTINLNFERKGDQIIIEVNDDGQGLDTDEIYSIALSAGLISPGEELSNDSITRLILEPGFTTRSKVTQTSGRGIGLDVVSVTIRELKGSLDISSSLGKGCRFTLSLPISSFSAHSLLVRSRQYIYAISSHGVEEILYPGIGEIRDVGEETIYQLGKEAYSVVMLDKLLNLPPDRRRIQRNVFPVLLVKDESGVKTAIPVQEVIDSRDVVVKNMGSYMPKLSGLMGATVLGDGSVSPVIDLPEMLHERQAQTKGLDDKVTINTSRPQLRKVPYVLVVDDSLSARRSLAQFVEDMGYMVRTARDGMEAIGMMEARTPDLLLVDMEMPKMNGLELTSHVRATSNIQDIPVIMITSRSTDKHRKTAMDKGVSHYMVKPFDEDELAQHLNTMLEIA